MRKMHGQTTLKLSVLSIFEYLNVKTCCCCVVVVVVVVVVCGGGGFW